MSIPSLPPIGNPTLLPGATLPPGGSPTAAPQAEPWVSDGGFGSVLRQGLERVSALERSADAAATGFAVGDGTKVHDVMIAGAKSQIAVDLLSQLRNKAVEAYTEIMRLQV